MDSHVSPPESTLKPTIPLNPLEPVTVMIDCPLEPAIISMGETWPAEMEKSGAGAVIVRPILRDLNNDPDVPVTPIVYIPGAADESALTVKTAMVEESMEALSKTAVTPDGRV